MGLLFVCLFLCVSIYPGTVCVCVFDMCMRLFVLHVYVCVCVCTYIHTYMWLRVHSTVSTV